MRIINDVLKANSRAEKTVHLIVQAFRVAAFSSSGVGVKTNFAHELGKAAAKLQSPLFEDGDILSVLGVLHLCRHPEQK